MEKETKTMKKKKPYCRPEMHVEEFTPNEYIAACSTEPGYTTYNFICNAGNPNGSYSVRTDGGKWIANKDAWDAQFTGYHPCQSTHAVNVKDGESLSNYFLSGTIDDQYKEGYDNTAVWIWTDNNTDVHCMLKTDLSGNEVAPTKNMS